MREVLRALFGFARIHPYRLAIVTPDMVISYGDFVAGIDSVASNLSAMKLDREKPIAVVIKDPARHLAAIFALAKLGYASVSPPKMQVGQAIALGVGAVIADEALVTQKAKLILARDDWFTRKRPSLDWHIADVDTHRIVRIALTSGTTGEAKAVGFTSDAILGRQNDLRGRLIMSTERVLLSFGIISHVGFNCALNVLTQGNTLYFSDNAVQSAPLIRSSAITFIAASIQQMTTLVAHAKATSDSPTAFDSVRAIMTGGSYASDELIQDLRSLFPGEIYNVYASTEAGSAGAITYSMMQSFGGVTNRFVPAMPIRIEQDESSDDEIGAIAIRSTHMGFPFTGSLLQAAPTDDEKWFYPGDRGYIDAKGFLVVVGRSDDLVNIGGVKRSAEYFEAHFRKVQNVRDCAIARIDTGKGPRFVLFLVSEREIPREVLSEWGRKDNLKFEFEQHYRVDSIPRNVSGKIDRVKIRELAQQRLQRLAQQG